MASTAVVKGMIGVVALLVVLPLGYVLATSPEWATLPQAVQRAPNLSLTYRAIEASGGQGIALSDVKDSVTFLAPDDASCASVKELRTKDVDPSWARRFVLSHTFHGQINVVHITSPQGASVRLNVVSNDLQMRSVIDGGSLLVTNLLGDEKRISVTGNVVSLGDDASVRVDNLVGTRTGSLGTINSCGDL